MANILPHVTGKKNKQNLQFKRVGVGDSQSAGGTHRVIIDRYELRGVCERENETCGSTEEKDKYM